MVITGRLGIIGTEIGSMNLFRAFMRTRLHTKILIGLIAGVPVGLLLGPRAGHIEFLGRLFILLIRMIVVPLVFSSLEMTR